MVTTEEKGRRSQEQKSTSVIIEVLFLDQSASHMSMFTENIHQVVLIIGAHAMLYLSS